MKISELVKQAHETAKAKGWWEEKRTYLEILALIHSEISEAVECVREGMIEPTVETTEIFNGGSKVPQKISKKPIGLPSELADVIIRIADFCGHEGIDLEAAIKAKMAYNKTRAYRHGGKAA
jgi:NTP pyrophosphatase (non-canonical NTP hydrolase)